MWKTFFSQHIAISLQYYCTWFNFGLRDSFEYVVQINFFVSLIGVLNVWTCRPACNIGFNFFGKRSFLHVIQAFDCVDKISITRNEHHSWKVWMRHFVLDWVHGDSDIDFFLNSRFDCFSPMAVFVIASARWVFTEDVSFLKASDVNIFFTKLTPNCVIPFFEMW